VAASGSTWVGTPCAFWMHPHPSGRVPDGLGAPHGIAARVAMMMVGRVISVSTSATDPSDWDCGTLAKLMRGQTKDT